MSRPIDQWGPRICPVCGAAPYVYCTSKTGRKASLPHPARWPEGGRRIYGKEKRRRAEVQAKRIEKEAAERRRTMPLDLALKNIEQTRMAVFRDMSR